MSTKTRLFQGLVLVWLLAGSSLVLASTAAPAPQTDDSAAPDGLPVLRAAFPVGHAPRVANGTWTDRVVGIPGENTEKAALRLALPSFSGSIVARGKLFKFTMVGTNPSLRNTKKVTVPVQVIPVRFDFPDGTVLDPAAPNSGCAGDGTPLDLTLQSPLFQDADYGDGSRQFVEEIRRSEFWAYAGPGRINPGYSVRLSASSPVSLHVTLPEGYETIPAPCGRAGFIDRGGWNAILGRLLPQLRNFGVSTKTFPIFLFLNVFTDMGDSFFASGFHSWFIWGGVQTYGVAMYDTTQASTRSRDVSVLSHEIAEWYDDPLVNNATPPWGHSGQVDGCQANLEVGDPLTGSPLFEIDMPNGFTYHTQETAFFSWFYNQVPSLGVNGLYSSGGSFTAPADLCQ
jgi:hypothetical protein